MTKRRLEIALVISMLSLVATFVARSRADDTAARDKRADLVAAAKEAYDAMESDFMQFRCVIDEVYLWSQRLLEAEQLQDTNANAAAEHAQRMRGLLAFVQQLREKNPQRVGRNYIAAKYYVLEAEVGQAAK